MSDITTALEGDLRDVAERIGNAITRLRAMQDAKKRDRPLPAELDCMVRRRLMAAQSDVALAAQLLRDWLR